MKEDLRRKINKRVFIMKSKIIVKKAVKRKKGYLYYIDRYGNICSCKVGDWRININL